MRFCSVINGHCGILVCGKAASVFSLLRSIVLSRRTFLCNELGNDNGHTVTRSTSVLVAAAYRIANPSAEQMIDEMQWSHTCVSMRR